MNEMKMNIYSYQDYMSESVDEENEKMLNYFEAVSKNTYYLRDNLQIPFITKVLEKPENRQKIINFVGEFINSHSKQLYTSGPVESFTFAEKETTFLYELFGLSEEKLLELCNEMIQVAYEWTTLPQIISKGIHKMLLTSISIEAIQKKYEDIITCCKYMIAFTEYPILYRNSWKLGVQEDIMNYTIEHLPNKFKVKKMNTLLALLKYDMDTVFVLCDKRLETGLDYQYIDFLYRCRNQIKATFVKIANVYYHNSKNNNSQHIKSGKLNDGSLADQEGYNTNVANIVENIYSKFLSNGVNAAFAGASADANKVDKDNLVAYLNQIYASKGNKLYKFLENVITSYISRNPTSTSVATTDFFNFGLALYRSIATSKDPLYQEMREILDFWMHGIINIKNYSQNSGTISNYTRAIFNYMIIMITHLAKS